MKVSPENTIVCKSHKRGKKSNSNKNISTVALAHSILEKIHSCSNNKAKSFRLIHEILIKGKNSGDFIVILTSSDCYMVTCGRVRSINRGYNSDCWNYTIYI